MKKTAYLLAFVLTVFMVAESYASIELNTLPLTQFVRSTGMPKTETRTFSGIGGPAIIRLINGNLTDTTVEKVSSSEIRINGFLVFGPSEFNQNVSTLERDINLNDGMNNSLTVLLKGKPGGTVSIQIIQILDNLEISPPEIILEGTGAISQIALTGELSNGTVVDITNSSYGTTCSPDNPYVASVSTSGLVTAISGGETDILVTNGQYTADIPVKVEVMQSTQTVGPGGGTLEFHNGMVLEIPAGALDTEVDITIKDLSYAEVGPILQSYGLTPKYFAGGFEGKPDGLFFNMPITVTIPVGPQQDSGDLPLLFAVDMDEFTYTSANTQLLYDPVTSTVSVEIPHFTSYAVAFAEHIRETYDCNSPDINVRCRCWGFKINTLNEDDEVVTSGETECYRKKDVGLVEYIKCPGQPQEGWTFREWELPTIKTTPPFLLILRPSETKPVTAMVTNAEGREISCAFLKWENPFPEIISISPTTGKTINVTAGVDAGPAEIWAKTGCDYGQKLQVEVRDIVHDLEVHASPMNPSFNYPIQLNVVAKNPQGGEIQINGQYITWSSNRPSPQPANFSSISGLSTTLTVSELGDITVYAKYDRSGEAEVIGQIVLCVHKRVASIEISPSSKTLSVGQPLLFDSVIPKAADGSSDLGCAFTPALTWNSTNPSVASVNAYGRVTANAVGQTTISATVTNGIAHGEASICVDIGPRSIQPVYQTVIVGGTVPFYISPASVQCPVISWNVDDPSIASLSVTQPDLTTTALVKGNSPGYAHIKASTGVAGSQTACRDSDPATVKVLDMNGTWRHQEVLESSNCPQTVYESSICTVTQTGSFCGAASYTASFTGPTFHWTLNYAYEIYPNVFVLYSNITGTVSDDGLHYVTDDYWTVSYLADPQYGWQYCSGWTRGVGTRLSTP